MSFVPELALRYTARKLACQSAIGGIEAFSAFPAVGLGPPIAYDFSWQGAKNSPEVFMAGDLKVVYAARTMQDAHLLRNLLEERGIRAIVTNAVLEGGAGVDVLGWATLARVAVNEEDAIAARQIALEFDRAISSQARAETGAEVVASAERAGDVAGRLETDVRRESLSDSWPRCPQCGAPRITKCPACGTSGSGFPPADQAGDEPAEASAAPPMLLCIECDEPFTPEYAHDCEWCGHEFPDGFRPAAVVEADEFSPGLLAVVGVTLAVVVGLLVYFAILLERAGTR